MDKVNNNQATRNEQKKLAAYLRNKDRNGGLTDSERSTLNNIDGYTYLNRYKNQQQNRQNVLGNDGSNVNWEAHNVINYLKLKEEYKVRQLANNVVDSLTQTGVLPSNYITKEQAEALGWARGKALNYFAPGKALGGNEFDNDTRVLPSTNGRKWYEADVGIDYTMSRSNRKNPGYRILYSNDGLIYGTYDHYASVFQIFP